MSTSTLSFWLRLREVVIAGAMLSYCVVKEPKYGDHRKTHWEDKHMVRRYRDGVCSTYEVHGHSAKGQIICHGICRVLCSILLSFEIGRVQISDTPTDCITVIYNFEPKQKAEGWIRYH